MEVSIADGILLVAAMVLVFVIAKLNHAIRLLNNRVNLISHAQKTMRRELAEYTNSSVEDEFEAQERELRARLDRDFR